MTTTFEMGVDIDGIILSNCNDITKCRTEAYYITSLNPIHVEDATATQIITSTSETWKR